MTAHECHLYTPEMTLFHIAVLPGDGVGVEVTAEAVKILRAVEALLDGVRFECTEYTAGAGEYIRNGDPLPRKVCEACREADAVLLGAMGLPEVRWPDGREMTPQIDLREQLDLYCGLRPIKLLHRADSPLRTVEAGEIDFLIVRENCEGLFSGRLSKRDPEAEEACDVLRISRRGAERIIRAACHHAERRRGKITLVDKANVLPSMVYFREIFDRVTKEFPGLKTERVYVDAAALYLVTDPSRFDVIVTENMFGDILSDLAAGLVGGMGMAPSGDIGENAAVFQPSHGTAPDIAGKGIANPVAAILSTAMMLDWLGTVETERGAMLIRKGVERVFADRANRTAEMGGKLTTSQMSDMVANRLVG
jgi:3-isopropylmalate dehydrogenase